MGMEGPEERPCVAYFCSFSMLSGKELNEKDADYSGKHSGFVSYHPDC